MGLTITRNWLSERFACDSEILSEVFGYNSIEINPKNMKRWFDSFLNKDKQYMFLAEFIVVLLGFREDDGKRVDFGTSLYTELMPDNNTLAWSIAVPFVERLRRFDRSCGNLWNAHSCPFKIVDIIEDLIFNDRSTATKMICQLSSIICKETKTKDIHEAHSKLVSTWYGKGHYSPYSYYLAV